MPLATASGQQEVAAPPEQAACLGGVVLVVGVEVGGRLSVRPPGAFGLGGGCPCVHDLSVVPTLPLLHTLGGKAG